METEKENFDLIIIGGGPAGIAAGIYAGRQKLNTLLVTKEWGGQIGKKTIPIENYPGFENITGKELIDKLKNHLFKFNIKVELAEVTKIEKKENLFFISIKEGKIFSSIAVIIASGTNPRPLKIEGEKEFLGKGVSYCALCDGFFFKGKTVAVIGAGNAGLETAIYLSKIAKKIYILEFLDKIVADQTNQESIKKLKNIDIILNAAVKKIEGKNFVNSLTYFDKKEEKEKKLKIDGVFVQIGTLPATAFLGNLVNFTEKGEIIIDPKTCQTKTEGLFAAGDVTNVQPKQIIVAAGEGTKAFVNAFRYINEIKNKSN